MPLSPNSEIVTGSENSRVYGRSSPKGMLLLEFQARRMSPSVRLGLAKYGPSVVRFSMSRLFGWWLILNAAWTRDPPTFPGGGWHPSPSHCRLSWKETRWGFLSRDSSNPDLVNRAPSSGRDSSLSSRHQEVIPDLEACWGGSIGLAAYVSIKITQRIVHFSMKSILLL